MFTFRVKEKKILFVYTYCTTKYVDPIALFSIYLLLYLFVG